MKHSCFRIVALVALLAAGAWSVCTGRASGVRPNIIFILADDLGLPGVGCYGGVYPTPNLDALAAGGIRFEHCFASPLCAPSRALAMMGRYGFRTGVVDNPHGARATPKKEICVAKVLKNAGYVTGIFGKWRQLAYFKTRADAEAWGFDEFLLWGTGSGEGGDRYWGRDYNFNGAPLKVPPGTYGPELLHQHLVDFVRRHREQPFFIYYPMTFIHGPFKPTPDTAPGVKDRKALYRDTIAYMDKLVGKLVAELDALGLREKTLIVFTGDNGSVDAGTLHGRRVDGVKHELKEGGSRVPLIANWKGTTPAGRVLPDLIDFTDFYVTFAELAGASRPQEHKLDGQSFAPQLRGEKGRSREWVFVQLADRWYVRDRRWKLYNHDTLCDMSDAPFSEKPIAPEEMTSEARLARNRLRAVLDELNPGQLKTAPKFQRGGAAG